MNLPPMLEVSTRAAADEEHAAAAASPVLADASAALSPSDEPAADASPPSVLERAEGGSDGAVPADGGVDGDASGSSDGESVVDLSAGDSPVDDCADGAAASGAGAAAGGDAPDTTGPATGAAASAAAAADDAPDAGGWAERLWQMYEGVDRDQIAVILTLTDNDVSEAMELLEENGAKPRPHSDGSSGPGPDGAQGESDGAHEAVSSTAPTAPAALSSSTASTASAPSTMLGIVEAVPVEAPTDAVDTAPAPVSTAAVAEPKSRKVLSVRAKAVAPPANQEEPPPQAEEKPATDRGRRASSSSASSASSPPPARPSTRGSSSAATYSTRPKKAARQATKKSPRKAAGSASSNYRGVCRNSSGTRWQVECYGKYIGTYDDEVEAAKAYDAVAKEKIGAKALLNFPSAAAATAAASTTESKRRTNEQQQLVPPQPSSDEVTDVPPEMLGKRIVALFMIKNKPVWYGCLITNVPEPHHQAWPFLQVKVDDGDKQQVLIRQSNMVKDSTAVAANPSATSPCGGVWYYEAEGEWRDDSVFFVERIVDKRRGAAGQLEYHVKWWNYPDEENTWEPDKNCLEDSAVAVKEFESSQSQVEWGIEERAGLRSLLLASAAAARGKAAVAAAKKAKAKASSAKAKGKGKAAAAAASGDEDEEDEGEDEEGRKAEWERIAQELQQQQQQRRERQQGRGQERSAHSCELEAWRMRHDPAWQEISAGCPWVIADGNDNEQYSQDDDGSARVSVKREGGTSDYRGVCRTSSGTRWQVQFKSSGGARHWVGTYDDEVEAAKAYDAVAKEKLGAKAQLNFPTAAAAAAAAAESKKKKRKSPTQQQRQEGEASAAAAQHNPPPKKPKPAPPPPNPPVLKPVGFRVLKSWSDLRPPCQRLSTAELTTEAKSVLAKKSKENADGLKWMNPAYREKVGAEAVLAALGNPRLLEQQVGVGKITDTEHPCMRESIDAGRDGLPAYLAFPKQALGAWCVVGEYTGHVRLETTVQEMEEKRAEQPDPAASSGGGGGGGDGGEGDDKANEDENEAMAAALRGSIPMAYNYVYQGTSRWNDGRSTLTVDAFSSGNELRYVRTTNTCSLVLVVSSSDVTCYLTKRHDHLPSQAQDKRKESFVGAKTDACFAFPPAGERLP